MVDVVGETRVMSGKWSRLIICSFVVIILSIQYFCKADKVLVGCLAGTYGVYVAESWSNMNSLQFSQITSLSGAKPLSITHDPKTGAVYVALESIGIKKVENIEPGTSDIEMVILLDGLNPYGLCIHNERIFWSDLTANKISSCKLDGKGTEENFVTMAPSRGIASYRTCRNQSFIYWANTDGTVKKTLLKSNGESSNITQVLSGLDDACCVTMDNAARKLYAANKNGRIVQVDLEPDLTDAHKDIYSEGELIQGISIIDDWLIFVELNHGVKAIPKNGGGELLSNQTSGLEDCSIFYSIHVINDIEETGPCPVSLNTSPSTADMLTIIPSSDSKQDTTNVPTSEHAATKLITPVAPSTTAQDTTTFATVSDHATTDIQTTVFPSTNAQETTSIATSDHATTGIQTTVSPLTTAQETTSIATSDHATTDIQTTLSPLTTAQETTSIATRDHATTDIQTTVSPLTTAQDTTSIATSDHATTDIQTTVSPLTTAQETTFIATSDHATTDIQTTVSPLTTAQDTTSIATSDHTTTDIKIPVSPSPTAQNTTSIAKSDHTTTDVKNASASTHIHVTPAASEATTHIEDGPTPTSAVNYAITHKVPIPNHREMKVTFEKNAELFKNKTVGVVVILDTWEMLSSIFPGMSGNETRIQTEITDTDIFEVDSLTKNSWIVEVNDGITTYHFKTVFPDDAWPKSEEYYLVTSILKLPLNHSIDVDNHTVTFGSRVISITMFNRNKEKLTYTTKTIFNITFSLLSNVTGQPSCYYLTPTIKWSSDGCNVGDRNRSHVTCSCDHMTSFAVLMQPEEIEIPISHQKALSYVSYIALSVSILCLVATIVLFVICKLYKKIRVAIHINLAVSLLLAQLLFVTGITSTNKVACTAVAVMLHYTWLAVFMWMLIEGLNLYLKVTPNIKMTMKLPICISVAWGLPAIVAFMTLGVSKGAGLSEYAISGRCWLTVHGGLVYAFTGPVFLITTVNMIFLFTVIYKFLNLKANQDKSEMERIKACIRALAILVPLLGITWVFGVIQFDQTSTIVFSYLFDIGNGLQGVFIFITQCLLDDDVKCYLKQKTSHGRVDNSDNTGVTN